MESTTFENVVPGLRDRASAVEEGRVNDVDPFGENGSQSKTPVDNRPSAIEQSRRRPYVKTPARLAAARANLEKARAAPKEKVYRRTEKRLTANRANLAKAKVARQQELEEMVELLDTAFPPLGEEISEEALEPEFICFCGSGRTFHQCCKGRKLKTGIPGPDLPRDPQSDALIDFT